MADSPGNSTTVHSGSQRGAEAAGAIKSGLTGLHGAGEAIRGNVNQAIDSAFNDKEGTAKNQHVAERGLREMDDGQYRGTGAGVTPADTRGEKVNRAIQGESTGTTARY